MRRHHPIAAGAILAALSLSLPACSASGEDASPPTSTAEAPPTAPTSSDRRIERADLAAIRRYIDAINARDADAAMALRCQAHRPATDEEERATQQQIDEFVDDVGPVEYATILPELDRRVQPFEEGDSGRTYAVHFAEDGEESGPPLFIAMIGQDGERRMCGSTPLVVDQDLTLPDAGPTTAAPRSLMPSLDQARYAPKSDESEDPRTERDEEEVWFRSWEVAPKRGASVIAIRYRDDAAAAKAMQTEVEELAGSAFDAFDVPGAPDAVGFAYQGDAYLDIQPPGRGFTIDAILQRFGDRVVLVQVTNEPGHRALAIDLAEQVHDLAVG